MTELMELARQFKKQIDAQNKAVQKLIFESDLTDEELLEFIDVYPMWKVGVDLVVDDYVKYEDKLYRVIYDHTTQQESDWLPDYEGSSLYTQVVPEGIIGEWVQPEGLHDSYKVGDKVTHNEKVWINTHENNDYEPGEYGWDIIE